MEIHVQFKSELRVHFGAEYPIKEFSEFQGIFHFFNGWDENIKTSTDIFALIADEYIDYSEILEFTKADEKREKQFLKSEMNVKSIQSKIKINLPFEKADKVFEKYFEMNFTNDRFDEIYQKFKVFLKILYNKVSKETEIKSVDLTEEEVKKMIGFFSYFKTDTEYPNTIFTYKVDDLIEFLERISGLDAKKEAWRQSHKPSNIAVETVKDLVKEINSIIPEKSAVKKRFEHKT